MTTTSIADRFLRDGYVAVPDALQPEFCEQVVQARFAELGIDDRDPTTWPRGRQNLPPTTVYPLAEVAPAAMTALVELVGARDTIAFCDLPDNLILNFPDPDATWWSPEQWDAPAAGWHKDGDWFRHFLDSPEQGLLGIVFWRDVVAEQGATYIVGDSIEPVARKLAEHPEGLDPPVAIRDIVASTHDRSAMTGSQGTIVWAHPFLLHSASVNRLDRVRVISNTSVMLRAPIVLSGPGARSPLAQSILRALDVDELDYQPTGSRERVVSERERRWKAAERAGD